MVGGTAPESTYRQFLIKPRELCRRAGCDPEAVRGGADRIRTRIHHGDVQNLPDGALDEIGLPDCRGGPSISRQLHVGQRDNPLEEGIRSGQKRDHLGRWLLESGRRSEQAYSLWPEQAMGWDVGGTPDSVNNIRVKLGT